MSIVEDLADAVVAVARVAVGEAGGELDVEEVEDAVLGELGGGHLDDDVLARLLRDRLYPEEGPLVLVGERRILDVGLQTEQAVWTHRLTKNEQEASTLDLEPDLAILGWLAEIDGGLHAADGRPLRRRDRRVRGASRDGGVLWTAHLEGPPGWLSEFQPGDLLAVRIDEGLVKIDPVPPAGLASVPDDFADRADRMIDEAHEGDGSPVWIEQLQLGALADGWWERECPYPPFGQLLTGAGLELDGRSVGRPGCWEANRKLYKAVSVLARYDLPTEANRALTAALDAFDAWRTDPTNSPAPSLATRLHAHPDAASAFVEETRRRGADAADLVGLARAMGEPRGAAAAVVHWLSSRAAALDGRAEDAERLAHASHEADPACPLAIDELAWCASDRGRAREAVNLLHRILYPDDPALESLRRMAAAVAPPVGRNEPCPCGSGRKFKHCHLGRVELPAADRARWLLDRARNYLERSAPPELLEDLVEAHDDGQGSSFLGMDALLFDGGWLERFVADRRPLLPDADVALAEAWCTSSVASVFRVASVGDDGRHLLVDVATGGDYVVEPSAVLDVAPIDRLILCRLVPDGDAWRTTGIGRLVQLSERERVLEAIADGRTSLADRVEAMVGPGEGPGLQNTSGQPLVLCTASIDSAVDGADTESALDESFKRVEGQARTWQLVSDDGNRTVLATIRYEGGLVRVETNSIVRHEDMVERLRLVFPGAVVVNDERIPWARVHAMHTEESVIDVARKRLGLDDEDELPDDEAEDDDEDSAALEAALKEVLEMREAQWIDEPLPALGGRSPRQAADDPELVADLRTLLAEADEHSGGFDVDRLRDRLGLAAR